MIICRMVRRF